ncbi:MAG: recombinase RecT [Eubacteriaceae bacterium]
MSKNEVAVKDKNITDNVLRKVQKMEENKQIFFPPNYSPENALKSAWLILQDIKTSKNDGLRPVLEVCSQNSIANSLLDMVVQGLNPMKNQCYFIAYGKNLTLQRSYLGTMAIAKRLPEFSDISFQVIYEGDEIEMSLKNGQREITKHIQKFENILNGSILGAYCIIEKENGSLHTEIMTIDQIKKAWNQGQMNGNSSAHKNFTDQMALKTVINRACKFIVNSSDDSSILTETFSRTSKNEDPDIQYELLDNEVEENQATKVIDIKTEQKPEPEENKEIDISDEDLPEFLQAEPGF